MRYFFIYSAGGGAGDWNGLKRIWQRYMPERLKSRILLKFGDIFLNHAPLANIIKPTLWKNIQDIRQWLYTGVQDAYVKSHSRILLDSGTSKIVNWVAHRNSNVAPSRLVRLVDAVIVKKRIIEKYAEVIAESNINAAVTFDIPNTFKIRTRSGRTRTTFFDKKEMNMMIDLCANYANYLYELLSDKLTKTAASDVIMTTICGAWNKTQFNKFLRKLKYEPQSLALGSLTRDLSNLIRNLKSMRLHDYRRVHFLGCGGVNNVAILKSAGFTAPKYSIDVSTPLNRAIDGNISGTTESGYFDYATMDLHRISFCTRKSILNLHKLAPDPIFSYTQMEQILDMIIQHQSGMSSSETYNARAKLIIHNNDVFRMNAA